MTVGSFEPDALPRDHEVAPLRTIEHERPNVTEPIYEPTEERRVDVLDAHRGREAGSEGRECGARRGRRRAIRRVEAEQGCARDGEGPKARAVSRIAVTRVACP